MIMGRLDHVHRSALRMGLRELTGQAVAWTAIAGAWRAATAQFEWSHSEYLWGLVIVGLWSLYAVLKPGRSTVRLQNTRHLNIALPAGPQWAVVLPSALRTAAMGLLLISAAGPQSTSSVENMTREGIDIILAMDVSVSMLSKDLKPNRLEASRSVAYEFVSSRPHDRVGLVVYEGESYTQVPLTTDHRVVLDGIDNINSGRVEGGTAIGMGLATAVSRLRKSEAKSRVIILFTDGENNAGQVNPRDAAQLAKIQGIRVYTIGLGSIGKAKSPVRMNPDHTYEYDWVDVKIDEPVLRDIASATGGRYFRATSKSKLREIYAEIDALEKTRFNVFRYNKRTEKFARFAWIGLLLLGLEALLRHTLFRELP
jgi:Ca-activated chloride channel family protein